MGVTEVNYAAWWSAVAASFSALTAFTMMRIQRRNLMESVRPELVVQDWSRTEEGDGESRRDVIRFRQIANIGRGTAFNIWIGSRKIKQGEDQTYHVRSLRAAFVRANDTVDVDGEIIIWWKNVEERNGLKMLHMNFEICCLDSLDVHYTKHVQGFASEMLPYIDGPVDEDETWTFMRTTTEPLWRRRLAGRFIRGWDRTRRRCISAWKWTMKALAKKT